MTFIEFHHNFIDQGTSQSSKPPTLPQPPPPFQTPSKPIGQSFLRQYFFPSEIKKPCDHCNSPPHSQPYEFLNPLPHGPPSTTTTLPCLCCFTHRPPFPPNGRECGDPVLTLVQPTQLGDQRQDESSRSPTMRTQKREPC